MELVLLILAICAIPVMLFTKPLLQNMIHKKKLRQSSFVSAESHQALLHTEHRNSIVNSGGSVMVCLC